MTGAVRRHALVLAVALVTATVTAGAPALAAKAVPKAKKAKFAKNAGKLDGLDSTAFAKPGDITWDNLAGIPAGFADGTDAVGGTADDVVCATPCVSVAELAFDPATQGELDGHHAAGSTDHDDRYYTETELNTSAGSGEVHWGNLTNVPPGLADGDDDTTYTGSEGIGLQGTDFRLADCDANEVWKRNAGDTAWVCAADETGPTTFWSLVGNAGTVDGTDFLGTTDNTPFSIRVNDERVARFEPDPTSPSVILGFSGNDVSTSGATIGGGGSAGSVNLVTDNFGTVSGGADNQAGDDAGTPADHPYTTVGGGLSNTASGTESTVAGGQSNTASGSATTVGGGNGNSATNDSSTVGGGASNSATGIRATVGGGENNAASGPRSTIGGGQGNAASGGVNGYATVGGGLTNNASGTRATIGGGTTNVASGIDSTIGGGTGNSATNPGTVVGGGTSNTANTSQAVVGGGSFNTAAATNATVGGGLRNSANADYSTISGGGPTDLGNPTTTNNVVTDNFGTIGGGGDNQAGNAGVSTDRTFATVGGGQTNIATGSWSIIGGGQNNIADSQHATIAGGSNNDAIAFEASVGGGSSNTASGGSATVGGGASNTASGLGSVIDGGSNNVAAGDRAVIGGGDQNTVNGDFATVVGGLQSAAPLYGQVAHAAGRFTTSGDAQTSEFVLRNTTADATPTELFLDGDDDRLTLDAGRRLAFEAYVVGGTAAGESGGYLVGGLIESPGGTTVLVGSPTVTVLGEDDASWDVAVAADNTNDALVLNVTGDSTVATRWVAMVQTAEVVV